MDYRKHAYYIRDFLKGQPVSLGATKIPNFRWKHLQKDVITDLEIENNFTNCEGIALLCGLDVSPFICLDFDLKNQRDDQDIWAAFMERCPKKYRDRFLINATASGVGRHIWLRTDYKGSSAKLLHRPYTIPELMDKYTKAISTKGDVMSNAEVSNTILSRSSNVCIVEHRLSGSYGVFVSPKYKRISGTKIDTFSVDEVEEILSILTDMDCLYSPPKVYSGKKEDWKTIKEYNSNTSCEDTLDVIVGSGLFEQVQSNDNEYRFLRRGSTSSYTGKVFKDGLTFCHSPNSLLGFGSKTPFEVLSIVKFGGSEHETLEFLKT